MAAHVKDALAGIWSSLGAHLPASDAVSPNIRFTGSPDPVLPSSFCIATVAQASIGACALLAKEIRHRRASNSVVGDDSPSSPITVDALHALAEFRSERYFRILDPAGNPLTPPPIWDPLSGEYLCKDGRYVRTHCNFPHHRDAILSTLGISPSPAVTRDEVSEALLKWDGEEFETAVTANGGCVALMRSPEEWDRHPQSAAVRAQPLVLIRKIPGSEGQARKTGAGIRVGDLTRVIAGPVAGRSLATHGATVVKITSPHLPAIEFADLDTGRGKLNAQLHLPDEQDKLLSLVDQGCDVFLQSYRPGSLAARGLSPINLAKRSPGIIVASLSAYGNNGPWAGKRGFDSLVQTATGINFSESEAFKTLPRPRALPVQALDHCSGYLLSAGIMSALLKRAEEGGSWAVEVSLARVAHWLARELDRVDPTGGSDFDFNEVSKWGFLERCELKGDEGPTTLAVRHAAEGCGYDVGSKWTAKAGFDRPAWP